MPEDLQGERRLEAAAVWPEERETGWENADFIPKTKIEGNLWKPAKEASQHWLAAKTKSQGTEQQAKHSPRLLFFDREGDSEADSRREGR